LRSVRQSDENRGPSYWWLFQGGPSPRVGIRGDIGVAPDCTRDGNPIEDTMTISCRIDMPNVDVVLTQSVARSLWRLLRFPKVHQGTFPNDTGQRLAICIFQKTCNRTKSDKIGQNRTKSDKIRQNRTKSAETKSDQIGQRSPAIFEIHIKSGINVIVQI
jgi:hypothetical protein